MKLIPEAIVFKDNANIEHCDRDLDLWFIIINGKKNHRTYETL